MKMRACHSERSEESRSRLKGILRLRLRMTLMVILALAVSACGGDKKAAPLPTEVGSAKVERGGIAQEVLFTGNITAKDFVEVFPRGHGRVSKKLLKEGDPVKKGEAILLIDRDEVGFSFKPLALDSPIDGYVGAINVDEGAFVYDRTVFNASPAAVVVQPGPMRVKLDVPERYLDSISVGAPVTMIVDTLGGAKYEGSIAARSPVVSDKTRTARVEVEVQNTDGRLRHGMFGRLKLAVDKRDGVIVAPLSAVSWEGEKTIVYQIVDGKVRRVEVKPGMRNGEQVEILDGLSEGWEVATGRLIDLEDGEAVTVKEEKTQEAEKPRS